MAANNPLLGHALGQGTQMAIIDALADHPNSRFTRSALADLTPHHRNTLHERYEPLQKYDIVTEHNDSTYPEVSLADTGHATSLAEASRALPGGLEQSIQTKSAAKILGVLAVANEPLTSADLYLASDMTRRTIDEHLMLRENSLHDNGLVDRHGDGAAAWTLVSTDAATHLQDA
jgi:DNA-binding IclR family transcriptional regulator